MKYNIELTTPDDVKEFTQLVQTAVGDVRLSGKDEHGSAWELSAKSAYDILSTHNGYIMQKSPLKERVLKLHHTTEQTEDELSLIVGLGGTVVDVFVWHKVYGKMEAKLNIFSDLHVKQFIEGVRTGKSSELMNITGGYHYHTIRADSEEILDRIENVLKERGYIAPGE